ncbi:MAG: hypothetical protein K2L89_09155, partial [Muribaculaceae bacterium]|nr:hypothetical protein [Muribaculaceae bacterium]
MRNSIKFLTTTVLTLCAFGAQSQTALSPAADTLSVDPTQFHTDTLHIHADTLHVTPAMVRELQAQKEVEEFKRDVESVVFVPKGQWIAGLSVSYTQSAQNNYQFLILENLTGDTYSFKISPSVCYMFRDDMGGGLKFAYQRSLAKLERADIVLGSDTEYAADYVYSLAHNYYATAFFRNYFSIGKSKRFGFFNEIQCQLGGGQSKFTKGVGDDVTGAYETNFSLDVGLVPGLCLFLNNYSAIEVNVGVLGFSYTATKTLTDRIYVAHRKSKSANFRINLFSITFGVSF